MNTKEGENLTPYSPLEINLMTEPVLRQLIWLTGEVVSILNYEEDAGYYNYPINPYNEGVDIPLTQDNKYFEQTGIHPANAWSELVVLLEDLKRRGYIDEFHEPSSHVFNLDKIEINLGSRKGINDQLFLELKATIANRNGQIYKNARSESKLKIFKFISDPCCIYDKETCQKLEFKNDNENTTILIRALFDKKNEFGGWVDNASWVIEGSFKERALYDAVRSVNKKMNDFFEVNEEFVLSQSKNKRAKLNLKAESFKIEQN